MRLFRAIQDATAVAGTWFTYLELPDGQKIEFCIKPIPAPEELRIEAKYLGRERKLTFTTEGQQLTHDIHKAAGYHQERALHALVDSKGADVAIDDPKSAELYSKALGGEPVKVGDVVVLDGKWTRAVAEQAFADAPTVAIWISQKAAALRVTAAGDEEGKGAS